MPVPAPANPPSRPSRPRRSRPALRLWWAALCLWAGSAAAQINTRDVLERDFLRYGKHEPYINYAFDEYRPQPIFGFDIPRYDRLGNYLMAGRVALSADEQRPGLSKVEGLRYEQYYEVGAVFNYAIMRDSYLGASYALLVLMGNDAFSAEPVRTQFSPLTLNMTRYTGVRLDVNGPKNKGSLVYTKGAGDRERFSFFTMGRSERSPVVLWGGHWQTRVGGALRLGSTFVNQHITDAAAVEGGIFKGNVPYDLEQPTRVVVRIVDDSPEDLSSRVAVYSVSAVIRGVDDAGEPTVITDDPELTGAGVELRSEIASVLEGRRVGDHYEAEGAEQIEFAFDLPSEIDVSAITFHAIVGGDYRIQIRQEHPHKYLAQRTRVVGGRATRVLVEEERDHSWPSPGGVKQRFETAAFAEIGTQPKYPVDFKWWEEVPAYTVARASGNRRDRSPQEVRFEYGVPTAQSLASVDLRFEYGGWRIDGELAANLQNFKFPVLEGKRDDKRATAYFLTLSRDLPLPRSISPSLGFEFFRLPADYSGNYDSRRGGAVFFTGKPVAPPNIAVTQEFDLFDDNDDGDQWPDEMPDDSGLGTSNDSGVYPGLDENGDNIPDTDQNSNRIPDWDEPFLFFWGDPPEFIYDIDMNNNGLPDLTENDDEPDYPYKRDQRGYHAFVKLDGGLPFLTDFSFGYHNTEQTAGGGKARAQYARFVADTPASSALRFVVRGDAKRVRDSIPDAAYIWKTTSATRYANQIVTQDTLSGTFPVTGVAPPAPDPMLMRNSLVGTVHLVGDLDLGSSVNVRLRHKLILNRQLEDEFGDGTVQEAETLSRVTLSNRIEYRRRLGNLTLFLRAKHLFWQDAGYPGSTGRHWSTYGPQFEAQLPLTEKTSLVGGQEGIPGLLGIRHTNHNDASRDFDRWTSVLMVRTISNYLGWRVATEIGVQVQRFDTGDLDVTNRTLFLESFFGW